VTIKDGKIILDIFDLLGELCSDQRNEIIDLLSCRDEVIDEVTNQIIDGMTTQGSHGAIGAGGDPAAVHGIDGARMRIAKASSDIAAREIERLGVAIQREKQLCDKGWAAYHKLLSRGRA
jgi:hypothetical protein